MLQKNVSKIAPSFSQNSFQKDTELELKKYKEYVLEKLESLNLIFAKASIGDFSDNIKLPDEDDEFAELYVGIQTMLEVIRDQLSELRELNQSLEKKAAQFAHHQTALLDLVKMDFGDLDSSIEKIIQVDADILQVDRVGVWLFNEEHSKIVCKDLYQLDKKSHLKGMEIKAKDY